MSNNLKKWPIFLISETGLLVLQKKDMKRNILGRSVKLRPVASTMSSVYSDRVGDRCINDITAGPIRTDVCTTQAEEAPWLALSFGEENIVSLEKVVIYNRNDQHGSRTKNVEVRLANELPESGTEMFSRGELLGTFAGPGSQGQQIEIISPEGWEQKMGIFLIIQMNMGKSKDHLNLNEVFAYGIEAEKLVPTRALMSSVFTATDNIVFSPDKCINGRRDGLRDDICHTKAEKAPWLAIGFEENRTVSIQAVVLFNRNDSTAPWKRTKNVEVRLANMIPPSAEQMFSGGELLGSFEGPASKGQRVAIPSLSGWGQKTGHNLIIQMDMGTANFLNLIEVVAYGTIQFYPTGAIKYHFL